MSFGRGTASPEARARQAQTDFIEESVHKVDKHFGLICNELGSVCRKTGRLRDKYDSVAKLCVDYANKEPDPLKTSLTQFAEHLSAIQDYRQAQIERLERKVIDPLTTYGKECKHTQSNLRNSLKTRTKELKQQDRVETLRQKSGDRHTLTQAEAELQRRSVDVERTTRALEETIDKFEAKKVQDLKKIFSEFIKIEMVFHAKALEQYTVAYNSLQEIQEEEHIEVFRNSLRPSTNMQNRMELANQATGRSLADSTRMSTNQTPPQPVAKARGQRHQQESEVDEDEDDDEEYATDSQEYDEDEESEEEEDEDEVEEIAQRPASNRARTKPW